ncbi:site-specific integrase [uncultured Pseudoalteromonas sp.]|uniref:site-specific integrase n=1 Tax=uncultured Pseudoalteromonas sp. TaxID=114053 RepID=UPI000C5910D4|nr:site-specific integrase [uncultured Pseudoalteromonas sp.]MBD57038.1 hypothetical protein [Pseudoalteromonas sp.]|tara:strand:+ start:284 stop:1675 length:1392 start_codon:yes stop_codon:yes gene_type:complete
MAKQKNLIPEDIASDIVIVKVKVEKYPRLSLSIDHDTGEINPILKSKSKPIYADIDILLSTSGTPVYPQNWYLHHQISKNLNDSSTTHAQALLAYTRWLRMEGMEIDHLTENPEEGAPWKFRDYLIENLRIVNHDTQEITNPSGFAVSTAKAYMRIVVNFYKWLHSRRVSLMTNKKLPFRIHSVLFRPPTKKSDDILLSHINFNTSFVVETTDLMKGFPKIQSTSPEKKLKPMTPEHKDMLEQRLASDDSPLALMVKVSLEVGLRLNEVVTLPESIISHPEADITSRSIGPVNRCKTKYNKTRTVDFPAQLMQELLEYKMSDSRFKAFKNTNIMINSEGEQQPVHITINEEPHGRLFVSQKGMPYSPNSIQTYFSKIRKGLSLENKKWYYKYHDCRSTYITYWLIKEQQIRNCLYDVLLGEISEKAGHSDTSTTQKYINFLNNEKLWLEFAKRRNDEAAQLLR